MLQALSLFFSGTKLAADHFFDESKPIRTAVTFGEITDADLARLQKSIGRDAGTSEWPPRLVRVYDIAGGVRCSTTHSGQ